jgi:hypothetical protein
MRQLQLIAHGEPSDVIELNTVSQPALGPEDVLISMEAAPMNPSDFLFVRGIYGIRPAFPSSVGAEGVGRVAKIGNQRLAADARADDRDDFVYRKPSAHQLGKSGTLESSKASYRNFQFSAPHGAM